MAEMGGKMEGKLVHDGISPIYVPDVEDEDEAFQMLWEYLVPPQGKARTAQGELTRIAGRGQYEFLGNGCVNWDEDFQKMLDAFLKYLRLGNGFSEEDLKIAEVYVGLLRENGERGFIDDQLTGILCSCAMA